MKQVLEVIIKNLVDNKDAVSINEIETEKGVTFQVKVDDSDIGKIIGKIALKVNNKCSIITSI